ncbi:NAD(P)/FAD-dependent oxidoreductase [Aquabacterium sp. OR-4]|uniref:NAD(P)/FAD-dependent oxidoreductase n=1 Tax=Aquabacterium sp. OR-4 TaxID=2978127 RepID=UPI0021B453DA|nr:NAD(P)/FAD-dependent oxidoreductase [Aquabacterium sp. OR-4]MDT7835181.1 NAD(P)/FAD-dependent oxidoreductase [Aquabacterium sp. OR-4]
MTQPTAPIETDALVIGAGPVGLFAVFELGLLELRAQLVDTLPQVGGQCTELYADKPIYDVPGIPVTTGRALVDQLMRQAAPFAPGLHLGQLLATLQREADGRWRATTDHGTSFLARVVFIAAGAGAFVPRSITLDGLDRHLGSQAAYQLDDAASVAGRQVVILGDEDAALEQAIALAEAASQGPARVTLVHRRDAFRADEATVARFQALRAQGALHFVAGQPSALLEDAAGRLLALDLATPEGGSVRLPLDALLIRMGLSPRLGPISHWGLQLERKQLVVETAGFQTQAPGIFAVGDIITYPGKRKLLLCGFHEATLAAFAAAAHVRPGQPVHLQYTTTSPRLHQLLGVASPPR